MRTRAWLGALLALMVGCEGVVGDRDGIPVERGLDPDTTADAGAEPTPDGSIEDGGLPDAGPQSDAGTEPDAGPELDAGTGTDGGMDAGTEMDAGACAGGPLAAPIPGCNPAAPPSTGDDHADCIARIDQLRWECQCLPPLPRWSDGEACADGNAAYDSINGVHASFYAQPCGTGARAQNECPGWPSTRSVITGCLQAMWDEGPEDGNPDTVNGHYESMASTSYTRVACGFYTTPSGQVWAVQNFD